MSDYLYQQHQQFFAQHAGGAQEAAAAELASLGATAIQTGHFGHYFKADPDTLYRIVYTTRISTRILSLLSTLLLLLPFVRCRSRSRSPS